MVGEQQAVDLAGPGERFGHGAGEFFTWCGIRYEREAFHIAIAHIRQAPADQVCQRFNRMQVGDETMGHQPVQQRLDRGAQVTSGHGLRLVRQRTGGQRLTDGIKVHRRKDVTVCCIGEPHPRALDP